jgi:hypothetical protein
MSKKLKLLQTVRSKNEGKKENVKNSGGKK